MGLGFRTDMAVRMRFAVGLIMLAALLFSPVGCAKRSAEGVKVLASTSLIGSMVRAVGGEKVALTVIVPSGMCPGHFDVKPGDIVNLSDADLIIYHGFETWIGKLVSPESESSMFEVSVTGNFMVPDLHIKAGKEITDALCKADPKNCDFFRDNMSKYEKAINSAVGEMSEKISSLAGTKVICSDQQEPFLKWIGFDIAAIYGRPEEMTPSEMADMLKLAKADNVKFFVDNLQSGPEAGVTMSEEVGAGHVTLTNFPSGDTWDSYIISLKDNMDKFPG